ncbi:twin-arginine translocation pathway signal [Shinella sp.]|uniref:twin-arginine translocation pathway signal n=1 Tax=Shinella sp. TaxID=1870904 RepID=UPI0040363D11
MPETCFERRRFIAAGAAFAVTGIVDLGMPARASALAATPSMRGGSNNYIPGAEIVERIGGGGFLISGTVRLAGDGVPLAGQRIQMWAHTTEGSERDRRSHGATLTDANGEFRLEMPQILPALGQAHAHLDRFWPQNIRTV